MSWDSVNVSKVGVATTVELLLVQMPAAHVVPVLPRPRSVSVSLGGWVQTAALIPAPRTALDRDHVSTDIVDATKVSLDLIVQKTNVPTIAVVTARARQQPSPAPVNETGKARTVQ